MTGFYRDRPNKGNTDDPASFREGENTAPSGTGERGPTVDVEARQTTQRQVQPGNQGGFFGDTPGVPTEDGPSFYEDSATAGAQNNPGGAGQNVGPRGPAGPAGASVVSVAIDDGTIQSDGSEAYQLTFTTSAMALAPVSFVAPIGPRGDDGDDGQGITNVTYTGGSIPGTPTTVTLFAGTTPLPNFIVQPGERGMTGNRGDQGPQGRYPVKLYLRSATQPSTPTDVTWNDDDTLSGANTAGWSLLIPPGTEQTWEVEAFFDPAGAATTITTWSAVFRAGAEGPPGMIGPTPNISVAANTGNPGTNAMAVRSGPDASPTITFTIPRGDKGDRGDPGGPGDSVSDLRVTQDTTYTGPGNRYTLTYDVGLQNDVSAGTFIAPRGPAGTAVTANPGGSNLPPLTSIDIGGVDYSIQGSGEDNVQADWNVTDTNSDAFIRNKPTIPTAASLDVPDNTHLTGTSLELRRGPNVIQTTDLSSIAGEDNVQSDWDEMNTSSDAYIRNKPTIPAADDTVIPTFVAGTSYVAGQVVYYQTRVYRARVDTSAGSNPPDNTTDWEDITSSMGGGAAADDTIIPLFNANNAPFAQGQMVYFMSRLYRARQATSAGGNPNVNTTDWEDVTGSAMGTNVVANPGGSGNADLTSITIGTTNYDIAGGTGTTVVANPGGSGLPDLNTIRIGTTAYTVAGTGMGGTVLDKRQILALLCNPQTSFRAHSFTDNGWTVELSADGMATASATYEPDINNLQRIVFRDTAGTVLATLGGTDGPEGVWQITDNMSATDLEWNFRMAVMLMLRYGTNGRVIQEVDTNNEVRLGTNGRTIWNTTAYRRGTNGRIVRV